MSLIPAFEIGLWNAWILMLYFPLHAPLMRLIDKDALKKIGSHDGLYNKTEKKIDTSKMVILFLLLIYSIFLPLQLGTTWFYLGLAIYLVGLIMLVITSVNIATTPLGKPFANGLYRYSRHPMYIGLFLLLLGVSITTASWVFLVLTIVVTVVSFAFAHIEEQGCLERYGEAYREYMNRTPRLLGIPKS